MGIFASETLLYALLRDSLRPDFSDSQYTSRVLCGVKDDSDDYPNRKYIFRLTCFSVALIRIPFCWIRQMFWQFESSKRAKIELERESGDVSRQ